MMNNRVACLSAAIFACFLAAAPVSAEYSPWTFFGGLNYVYNSNGDGVTEVGPGGLDSAPSPLVGIIGVEYRHYMKPNLYFAPSASLFLLEYLWADGMALPAEIENRTAIVPSILLDGSFLYTFERDRFLISFGGGPAILLRYAFLDPSVDEDAVAYTGDVPAGEQVGRINGYLWGSLRWFYPMLQASAKYRLENEWGAGLSLRIGLPIFNIWSDAHVSLADSLLIIAALTFTPPAR